VKIASVTAAAVKSEPVRWASRRRIPVGEPTIIAGVPGIGKTQYAIGFCADATRGRLDGDLVEPVNAAYISAEDSITYTLAPRFLAAGGDPERIHFYRSKQGAHRGDEDPSLQLPNDIPLIDQWMQERDARILVLDPFVAMIPPSLNSHRDQHMRRAIAPLAHMCHKRKAVVLLILHLNKAQEGDALSRLSGSIGFGAAARSVLLFAPSPHDPDGENGNQRILAHTKSNLGRKAPSLAYRIEARVVETANGPISTSVAVPGGETNISAGDLLGSAISSTEANARTEACDFLLAELANGPVATKELRKRAEDAGHNWRTVERAKAALGIRSKKSGSSWAWSLNTALHTPTVGLDGVVGVHERKADKVDKTAGIVSNGGLPPDKAADPTAALRMGQEEQQRLQALLRAFPGSELIDPPSPCRDPQCCEHRHRYPTGPWTCEHNHPTADQHGAHR
jgi:hypothetical protein